ncbi:MAG: hypothetical protein R6U40_05020 [Desulfobacterales bacterium]
MKKILFSLLVILFLSCTTGGTTLDNRYKVHPNMTKDEVVSLLGAPRSRQPEGDEWEKWVYYEPGMDKLFFVYFYKGLVGETWESVMHYPN